MGYAWSSQTVRSSQDKPDAIILLADDGTYSDVEGFNWTINSAITITDQGDQTNNEGDSVSVAISASDSNSDAILNFQAQGLPPGLSINSSTGVITGTVALGDSLIGSFAPVIVVNDGTYSNTDTFNGTINGALSLSAPDDQSNVVGDTVSLPPVVSYTGNGTLTYSAFGLPNGLSINKSTGVISGTISSAATAIGTFSPIVTVTDGSASASEFFNWTVSAAGSITMATPANQSSSEGASVSLSLSATGSGTLRYFAEGLPPGLMVNKSTGAITRIGTMLDRVTEVSHDNRVFM